MRTIKFKGKNAVLGEWVYGDLFQPLGYFPMIVYPKPTEDGKIKYCRTSIDEITLCQFTGLTDKNGKDIYEGDILTGDKYPFNCDGVDNYYLVIEEVDSDGFLSLAPISRQSAKSTCKGISDGFERDWDSVKNAEIIGNIYDNVELLKDYEL